MKLISKHPRSKVFYNIERDSFIKTFTPKLTKKIKFFFRLRKYPGENFFYISNFLNSLNIRTPDIINHSKYSVETKSIHGISLKEALEKNLNSNDLVEQYVSLVLCLLENNVYCGDLKLENFIVNKNQIYVLDLEDYRHVVFCKHTKKEFLDRLKGKIPKDIFKLIIEKAQNSY